MDTKWIPSFNLGPRLDQTLQGSDHTVLINEIKPTAHVEEMAPQRVAPFFSNGAPKGRAMSNAVSVSDLALLPNRRMFIMRT